MKILIQLSPLQRSSSPLMTITYLYILLLTKVMLILIKLFTSKGLLPLTVVIVLTNLSCHLTITAPHERCAHIILYVVSI